MAYKFDLFDGFESERYSVGKTLDMSMALCNTTSRRRLSNQVKSKISRDRIRRSAIEDTFSEFDQPSRQRDSIAYEVVTRSRIAKNLRQADANVEANTQRMKSENWRTSSSNRSNACCR
jgi:hypothetical protein